MRDNRISIIFDIDMLLANIDDNDLYKVIATTLELGRTGDSQNSNEKSIATIADDPDDPVTGLNRNDMLDADRDLCDAFQDFQDAKEIYESEKSEDTGLLFRGSGLLGNKNDTVRDMLNRSKGRRCSSPQRLDLEGIPFRALDPRVVPKTPISGDSSMPVNIADGCCKRLPRPRSRMRGKEILARYLNMMHLMQSVSSDGIKTLRRDA